MGSAGVRSFAAVLLVVCRLVAAPAAGQDIPLWPDGAPEAKGTAAADIPTLKVFPAPKDAAAPVPAVLLIPGGGYKHISSDAGAWAAFKDKPVRFFSMKYRLPTNGYRHPAPLQDAARAVRTIRARAKEWNLDPNRLVVVAFSSGGHVATTLATHFTLGDPKAADPAERFSSRPDCMVLFCPVVSMIDHPHGPSVARLLGPDPGQELLNDLSNERQVTAKTPPTMLGHAKDDKNPWKQDMEAWLIQRGILP
jgi:acetyl esterase/lipase